VHPIFLGFEIGLELTDAFGGRGRSRRRANDRPRAELLKAFTLLIQRPETLVTQIDFANITCTPFVWSTDCVTCHR
jgi:hypothetical protein